MWENCHDYDPEIVEEVWNKEAPCGCCYSPMSRADIDAAMAAEQKESER